MARFALVKDGKTVNVIEWDAETEYTPPEGCKIMPAALAPPMPEPFVETVAFDPKA